jgi:hypothetical protein
LGGVSCGRRIFLLFGLEALYLFQIGRPAEDVADRIAGGDNIGRAYATTMRRALPAECREWDTWRHVTTQMNAAARGGDIKGAAIALRLVLQLDRVPVLLQ